MGVIQSSINQGLAIGSALYTQMKKEETTQEKLKKTQKQYYKYKKGAQTHLKNVREKYENIIKQYDKEKQGLAIDRTMEQMNISKTIKPKNMYTSIGYLPTEIIEKAKEVKDDKQ